LLRKYGMRVAPTTIIDGEVKVEGQPDIPFVCGEETYAHFKTRYPSASSRESTMNTSFSTSLSFA
jgi:hypothetical protein